MVVVHITLSRPSRFVLVPSVNLACSSNFPHSLRNTLHIFQDYQAVGTEITDSRGSMNGARKRAIGRKSNSERVQKRRLRTEKLDEDEIAELHGTVSAMFFSLAFLLFLCSRSLTFARPNVRYSTDDVSSLCLPCSTSFWRPIVLR